jgi:hypothetical protein
VKKPSDDYDIPFLSQDSEPGACIGFAGFPGKQPASIRIVQGPATWRAFLVMALPDWQARGGKIINRLQGWAG